MFWTFALCAFCASAGDTSCPACHGTGVVATPSETLDLLVLAADHRRAIERYRADALPPTLATLQSA